MPAYIDSYDKLDWMEEALQSVQPQTFTDWEVIIIDDSSPIDLTVLQNQFESPKFRWFKARNSEGKIESVGPSLCRNTAVELSKDKKAILPLDADDMLAHENVLNIMYTEWANNPKQFYYGNLRKLKMNNGKFELQKVIRLADYTFERSKERRGVMPVSCIMSYDCWQAAGGWKAELNLGREDVEFWISAGKAGYCGQKIDELTLIYRRHPTSRDYKLTNTKGITNKTNEVWKQILSMHSDVFGGKYPMGCCGGEKNFTPIQNQTVSAPSTLKDYPENERIWVEYAGHNSGGFNINGQTTGHTYRIKGPGHKLQAHTSDLQRFKSAGRGQDFIVPTIPPDDYKPIQEELQAYNPPDAKLAMIERKDVIAEAS